MVYLQEIPPSLRSQLCTCTIPSGFTRLPEGHGEQYWVCGKCNKPRGLWHILECICCEELYVAWEWPDKTLLCKGCFDAN